jgi:CheY-like chemotaxis protein
MLFRQQFRHDIRTGRFTMDFAQSGDSALQRINDAAGASLILILSDINMPGMTGLELLPKAKAARPDVPVIMITAYGDDNTRRKALERGAEALLTKPIDFIALRGAIDSRVASAAQSYSSTGLPLTDVRFGPNTGSGRKNRLRRVDQITLLRTWRE